MIHFKMSSTGSDKEKSFGFGFYSYITNDHINLEALSNTHPSSHSFHQGTWLGSVPRTRELPGCSQVLARAQDHQGLGREESPPSPLKLMAAFPSSELQGRVSDVSLAVGQGPLSAFYSHPQLPVT